MSASQSTFFSPRLRDAESMAKGVLRSLQQGQVRNAVEQALFFRACHPHIPESHTLCALSLSRANAPMAALLAWNEALKRDWQRWHAQAFRFCWSCMEAKAHDAETVSLATALVNTWGTMLMRTFLSAPPVDLLAELPAHALCEAWGCGSVGIHQNALRGWLWLPVDEAPRFVISAGGPKLIIESMRRTTVADRALHEFSLKLPPADTLFFVDVTGTKEVQGGYYHAVGSPVPCDPTAHVPALRRTKKSAVRKSETVAVIVPVYDDRTATLSCLASVFASRKACKTPFEVVVVWDHGPDTRLLADLQRLTAQNRIRLHSTSTNVGFLSCVNLGIQQCPQQDVILLNADTLVSGDWLDRLHVAAAQPDVATVTPLGSDAELVSFPTYTQRATVSRLSHVRRLDAACKLVAKPLVEIPVGVGFCMYITRKALHRLGGLDGYLLFSGYGEEVDFCLHARKLGMKNLAACNVFVAHLGGRSFGAAKRALVRQNNKALFARYPDYNGEYHDFLSNDPLQDAKEEISRALYRPLRAPLHVYSVLDVECPGLICMRNDCGADKDWGALLVHTLGQKTRVTLQLKQEFSLPDRHFTLPEDTRALHEALIPLEPHGLVLHQNTRAARIVSEALPALSVSCAGNQAFRLPAEPQSGPHIWLTTPPRTLAAWQALCVLARRVPLHLFWTVQLEETLGRAPRPDNIRPAPMLNDFQTLGVQTLLILPDTVDALDWQERGRRLGLSTQVGHSFQHEEAACA